MDHVLGFSNFITGLLGLKNKVQIIIIYLVEP